MKKFVAAYAAVRLVRPAFARVLHVLLIAILAILMTEVRAFGQTAPSQPSLADLGFSNASLSFGAMAIHGNGQTLPVSDLSQTFTIVKGAATSGNFSLRLDEFLASSDANFSSYMAGGKYFLPTPKFLQNTNLSPLQLYVSGEGGVTRVTPASATGSPVNKAAGRALFGANWNPTSTGAVSFNIGEVGYAYLPGLVAGHNSFVTVSASVKLNF